MDPRRCQYHTLQPLPLLRQNQNAPPMVGPPAPPPQSFMCPQHNFFPYQFIHPMYSPFFMPSYQQPYQFFPTYPTHPAYFTTGTLTQPLNFTSSLIRGPFQSPVHVPVQPSLPPPPEPLQPPQQPQPAVVNVTTAPMDEQPSMDRAIAEVLANMVDYDTPKNNRETTRVKKSRRKKKKTF